MLKLFLIFLFFGLIYFSFGCEIQQNKDIEGNDFGSRKGQLHECCGFCNSVNGCKAFAWNDWEGGTCWFKNSIQPIIDKSGVSLGIIDGGGGSNSGNAPQGSGVKFILENKCPFDIWPGILPPVAENGGFYLPQGQTREIYVPDGWNAGRIWARRGCNGNMNCDSGFCRNKIQCEGAGGVPPVTLAEFTLNGHGNQDYYDVSLVDGYNLPIIVLPIDGTYNKIGGEYDCMPAGACVEDLFNTAPEELKNYKDGRVVSVSSACHKFNSDEYCCRGAHNQPETCQSKHWKTDYPAIFKKACRTAYSYAYDDIKSTFFCRGSNGRKSPDYRIQFC